MKKTKKQLDCFDWRYFLDRDHKIFDKAAIELLTMAIFGNEKKIAYLVKPKSFVRMSNA